MRLRSGSGWTLTRLESEKPNELEFLFNRSFDKEEVVAKGEMKWAKDRTFNGAVLEDSDGSFKFCTLIYQILVLHVKTVKGKKLLEISKFMKRDG